MDSTILIIGILLGPMQITSYQSVRNQTDSSPHITSIGYKTHRGGIAVSQDLLCNANKSCNRNIKFFCQKDKLHYGDYIYVKELGIFEVNDCMNRRHKNRMDVWVGSQAQEKAFHARYKNTIFVVYRLKEYIR